MFKIIFNALALALALALGLCLALRPASPDEAQRQVALGRVMAGQAQLPNHDIFSYSQGSKIPFNRDGWGYALASFGLSQAVGAKAPQLIRGFSLLACLGFLLACGFRRQARPFSTAFFALAAVLSAGSEGYAQVTGLAFFSACLYVMEGKFWEAFFGRWVWLPLLAVGWVNLDASALLLVPFCWIWAFAEKAAPGEEAPQLPLVSRLSVLSLLSASLFLHPAFWRLPLQGLDWSLAPPFAAGGFAQSQWALGLLALAFLLLVSSSWLQAGREHLGRDAWLFVFFAAGSLIWKGLLPWAVLWAAPMLAARSDILVDSLPEPLRSGRWILKLGLFALGLWMLPGLLSGPMASAAALQPATTLNFLRAEMVEGNIFTEESWEGTSLAALAPSLRVFEHQGMLPGPRARARAMQAEIFEALPSAGGQKASWELLLERTDTDFALLKLNTPLAKAMARSAYWQPLDFDDASVLYARVLPKHAALIKTYAPRGLRPGDLDEPFEASRLPQVEADLEQRLLKNPSLGILYYFEGLLWKARKHSLLARQWLERGLKADPAFAANYRLLGELRILNGEREAGRRFLEKAAQLDGRMAP